MVELKWTAIERDIDRRTWAVGQVHIDKDMEIRDEVQTDDYPTSRLRVMRWTEEGVALLRLMLKRKFVEPVAELSDDLYGTDKLDVDVESWLFKENARRTGANTGGSGDGEVIEGEWGGSGLMIEDSAPLPSEGVISERTWAMLMHRFVVTYVMWQWCHLYFPEWEGRYQKQYQDVKGTLARYAWNIAMPVKHKRPKMMDVESVVLTEGETPDILA